MLIRLHCAVDFLGGLRLIECEYGCFHSSHEVSLLRQVCQTNQGKRVFVPYIISPYHYFLIRLCVVAALRVCFSAGAVAGATIKEQKRARKSWTLRCHLATDESTGMKIAVNPYKESLLRLVEYVGLQSDDDSEGATVSPPRSGTGALFFHETESPEWRAYVASLPLEKRHEASVKRRLSTQMLAAMRKDVCLWCWFSKSLCFCNRLEQYRQRMLEIGQHSAVEVTIVLHPEEFMRGTNSGHIAAFILGAPIRIWGVPEDDAYLNDLPAVRTEEGNYDFPSDDVIHTVSLYPEKDAFLLEDFVKNIGSIHRVHLLLMDATWSQANALNRHIPRHIPRVALRIDESYASLFKALRKRTRQSGVSTFEATTMALQQCYGALCPGGDDPVVAGDIMTSAMKEFVDVKCLLSHRGACFVKESEVVADIIERRNANRRDEAINRLRLVKQRVMNDVEAQDLLNPPVLNYCYACDVSVGWSRMTEHVMGRAHMQALGMNPLCTPSETSRNVKGSLRGHYKESGEH